MSEGAPVPAKLTKAQVAEAKVARFLASQRDWIDANGDLRGYTIHVKFRNRRVSAVHFDPSLVQEFNDPP